MSTALLAPETKLITADEYALMPEPTDGNRYELVRGRLVAMSQPSVLHAFVQGNIYFALRSYTNRTRQGRAATDCGLLTERDPDSIRAPDLVFWSYGRMNSDIVPNGFGNVPPELVVEVSSPSNTRREIAEKIREYFAFGASLVWIVEPEDRTVTMYRKPGDGVVLWDDAIVVAEDVLPGFSCPVADFFVVN